MSEQGILNESAVPSGISDPAVNPAIDQPQVPATNVVVSSLPQITLTPTIFSLKSKNLIIILQFLNRKKFLAIFSLKEGKYCCFPK